MTRASSAAISRASEGAFPLTGDPLIVAAVQALDAGEQAEGVTEASRVRPQAFVARERSRTAYEHLSARQASRLAREAFPALIDKPSGLPSALPSGDKVVGYPAENAAEIVSQDNRHSVVESLEPVALQTSPGRHVPLDLALRHSGHTFQPVRPAVRVQIPQRLSEGIGLGQTGVSLTPADATGGPLSGTEGELDGATVMYAETLHDADTVVKPSTFGFSAETLLRSVDSPRQLYFRVAMPAGAHLVASHDKQGAEVLAEGTPIAMILPPAAHDAEGTPVPISLSVSGDLLEFQVGTLANEYRFPIDVDPDVSDPIWANEQREGTYYRTNWIFEHEGANFKAAEHPENGTWTEEISDQHNASEYGGLFYTTRGESQITLTQVEGHWNDKQAKVQNYVILYAPKAPYTEDYDALPESTEPSGFGGYACAPSRGCPESTPGPAPEENNNTAGYEQESTGAGATANGTNTVTNAYVDIEQNKPPTIEFNKSTPTLYNERTKENIPNVLYGSGEWLGPHHGGFEVVARDPGIGISEYRVVGSADGAYWRDFFGEGDCAGIQCTPEYGKNEPFLYNPRMTNGDERLEAWAMDHAGLEAQIWPQVVKVDSTPPHNIQIAGFRNGSELPLGEAHLEVEATDGEGTTPSSGVKSITVTVDGHEVAGSAAHCATELPCTASSKITLDANDYASGQHSMVVTATDNADNVAQEEFTFTVAGAAPVAVGPGSVDPSTGEFTLNATDVSLGGTAGVSRTYQSRHLTAGAEGPLGPQWAINLGAGENLTALPGGDALLTAAGGARTLFAPNAKGELVPPAGDRNLTLAAKEKESGTEYLLSDPTNGTQTKFEQLAGMPPTFTGSFGVGGSGLKQPVAAALDPSGHVWVTNYESGLIEKFSSTGALIATYGAAGAGSGEFTGPSGIAIDPRNSNVYVSDQANNRIEELSKSGQFIKTFGWGVSNGNDEFEICTGECKAGIVGAGNGQFNTAAGLAVDSSGNVWVADYGNNRIQEFNEKGEYVRQIGKAGKEAGQLEGPTSIALPPKESGHLLVTDSRNNRVEEFTTAGVYVRKFGEAGTGSGQFSQPYGIATNPHNGNIYVTDTGNKRGEEFTALGVFLTRFGVAGTGPAQFTKPEGVVVSSSGELYVVDNGANEIQEWMRDTWLPAEVGGPLAASETTYAYSTVEEEGTTVIQPTEALAPAPAGVNCSAKLERGCRALTFSYATTTTARGSAESEWGEYKGHLERVYVHAWNPLKLAMTETEVAHYQYDAQGRLRSEWDPRISPVLKTIYGYDEEGHVTALTPPGQESWAFTYGSLAGDPNNGKLMKVTRAPASAPTWKGALPKRTEAPAVSGSPILGERVGVSHGVWSNEPVIYSYQWEDCNTAGQQCAVIPGAINANYTPAASDEGRTLAALVTATNGGGSVATTAIAGTVGTAPAEYKLPILSYPTSITAGPDGNMWFTTAGTVGKSSTAGVLTQYAVPSGSSPANITSGPDGNLWYTDWGSGKIGKVTTAGSITEYNLPTREYSPEGIAAGPDGNIWYTVENEAKIGKMTTSGTIAAEYSLPAKSEPYGITTGPDGNLWFTDAGTNKIGKITTSGTITEYSLPEKSLPYSIATGSDGNLWFTEDGTSKIGKITTSGAITEFTLPKGSGPEDITAAPDGNLWYTERSDSEIAKITTAGTITEYALSNREDHPEGIAAGPDGDLWYTDWTESMIGKMPTAGTAIKEGEEYAPQPGTTIEYHIPVVGAGLPNVSQEEVSKWNQKNDDPVEGAAIFPPDEPTGWPATGYKRATLSYWDTQGRLVNRASPGGGIATSEYNSDNEVVRTLSADNRATALKEGTKAAEVAKLLSTESRYSGETKSEEEGEEQEAAEGRRANVEPGTELLETLGPQHKVKLAEGGSEVLARNHVRYFYDEGAPENKHYGLLTRTTDGAEYEGKEADIRTSLTSYAGQHGIGWKLRKATSTTADPAGLDLTHTTEYNESGAVTETKAPEGTAEAVYPPTYASAFGSSGTGNGQFNHPEGIAVASSGNVWAVDQGNDRIEQFAPSGAFDAAYGAAGTGDGQFESPWGVAVNQTTGNVYVADKGNNRIQELTAAGEFVEAIGWGVTDGKSELEICKTACKAGIAGSGNGQLHEPVGLTLDSAGDLWVTDAGNDRIEEFSPAGAYVRQFGSKGAGNGQLSEPAGIATSEGEFYVVDYGNDRVEEFSPTGTYIAQFGSKGTAEGQFSYPAAVAANTMTGDLYITDAGNSRVEEFSPAGKLLATFGTYGTGNGQLNLPTGIAINSAGQTYLSDQDNNRVSVWQPPGAGGARMLYSSEFGSTGTGNGQFSYPISAAVDGHGNIWVTDFDDSRIEEFSSTGKFIATYGSHGSGHDQFSGPSGIGINQSTGNVYVGDCSNHRIEELNSAGEYVTAFGTAGSEPGQLGCPYGVKVDPSGNVWVADEEHNRIEEYSSTGTFIAAYGTAGSGEDQFESPTDLAFSGGNVYVVDSGNHRIEELSNAGKYIGQFGSEGGGSGQFYEPTQIAADSAGNLYVVDGGPGRVQEFSPSGTYLARFGASGSGEGQLTGAKGIAINAAGSAYIVDSATNTVQQWMPVSQAAHDTQTIYYTTATNSEHTNCGAHPEWAGLACQSQPAAQPETGPSLPVSTYTYNIWDELEKTTEVLGTTTRTKAETYDNAGRPLTSETTSTIDEALPKVKNTYTAATGELTEQTTETSGKTESVTSKYNTLGQLSEYTDASGNVAKYTYDVDGRVSERSERKGEEAKSSQSYSYDPTTGDLTKLVDTGTAPYTFTAEYDVEGKITTEKYPNGMNANYTYNSTGQATSLEYIKETHCTENCAWFSDHITPSIHGETLTQTSSLATERYAYDKAGRLAETQEEPAGKPCVERLYGYDEESNRTSLTAREGTEGKCPTEGGAVQRHTYDQANRVTDTGTTYETFGNITQLPTADAGKAELISTYYVDNQLATQKESGETINYSYDPDGRTLETISEGTTSGASVSHYSAPGAAVTWTAEGSGKWTRNIAGIDGTLSATQTSTGTTTLQLQDLEGNIVATASTSETEKTLSSTYNSTEFGVPQPGTTPPKYAWLGASALATESGLSAGIANPGGQSYIPLIGRALQTQAVAAPGAFPVATGSTGVVQASYLPEAANSIKALAVEHEAELEEAARRQAEERAVPSGCQGSECPSSEGNFPAPTEGGAELAYTSEEEIVSGTGGDSAEAARIFEHTWYVQPSVAYALGEAITLSGSEVGQYAEGLVFIPTWLHKLLDAMSGGQLQTYGDELMEAGLFAAPDTSVELDAWGSLRLGFHLDVSYWVVDAD